MTDVSTNLRIVKGYPIDIAETPYQSRTPIRAKLNQVQKELVSLEVKEMLEKIAIRDTIHCKDQFARHQSLLLKKDGGQRPVINQKDLNTFIP